MAASMYQAFVEVVPDASNLRRTLAREFDSAGPEAGRSAGRGINSGILGSIGGLAAPVAAAIGALGLGKILSDSVTNASDFSEAGTAITAVFGDADATIQKFAAGSANALGQSTNMTLDAARTFGVFGKAAGLGGEDLAGFSTEFITLAGDLASFNNTTPEQAIEALGAGLRGESEPLRQYGVLLDDATLKARATELGIYSGSGALTAQQKILASQAEIMAQTGDQQGDFAKTSGGLANQQRILSAGLENLSTTFGALLLPVMTTVVGFLNRDVVPAFQGVVGMLTGGETPGAVTGFMASFQPLIDFFKTSIMPAFASLGPIFAPLIPQLLELWSAFSPLSLILAAIGPQLPGLVLAFAGLAASIAGALGSALTDILPSITALSGSFVEILSAVLTNVLPPLMAFAGWLSENINVVLGFAVAIGAAVAAFQLYTLTMAIVRSATVLWAGVQAALNVVLSLNPIGILVLAIVALVAAIIYVATQTTFFQDAWAAMVEIFVSTIGMFSDFFTNTIGMFADFFSNTFGMFSDFGAGVVSFISGFWAGMKSTFAAAIAFLLDLFFKFHPLGILISNFDAIVAFLGTAMGNIGKAVSTGIDSAVTFFADLPGKAVSALGNLGSTLLGSGKSLIQGFIDGISGMLGKVGDAVGGVMDFVAGFFPNSPAKHGPLSGAGWRKILTSGTAIGTALSDGLENSITDLDSLLSSSVNVGNFTPRLDPSVQGSAVVSSTSSGSVYVQNPFTGEYLLAEVSGVADARIGHSAANDSAAYRRGMQR